MKKTVKSNSNHQVVELGQATKLTFGTNGGLVEHNGNGWVRPMRNHI